MTKVKTHKGAAKRFRRTGSGKLKRGQAMRRHILTKKSAKKKRQLRRQLVVPKGDTKRLNRMLEG